MGVGGLMGVNLPRRAGWRDDPAPSEVWPTSDPAWAGAGAAQDEPPSRPSTNRASVWPALPPLPMFASALSQPAVPPDSATPSQRPAPEALPHSTPPSARALMHLRRRGHRGGAIRPHRALWHVELPAGRVAGALALALAWSLALMALRPLLSQAWSALMLGMLQPLALPGRFAPAPDSPPADAARWLHSPQALVDWLASTPWAMPVPQLALQLPATGTPALAAYAVLVLLAWLVAGRLPQALRALADLLRLVALVLMATLAVLAVSADGLAHGAAEHLGGGLRQMWWLMLATPWLHLVIHYLLPWRWRDRLALTAMTLAWLALLAPLLYTSHALALALLGSAVLPLLHLLGGLLPALAGVVALYTWAMGWAAARTDHDPR